MENIQLDLTMHTKCHLITRKVETAFVPTSKKFKGHIFVPFIVTPIILPQLSTEGKYPCLSLYITHQAISEPHSLFSESKFKISMNTVLLTSGSPTLYHV